MAFSPKINAEIEQADYKLTETIYYQDLKAGVRYDLFEILEEPYNPYPAVPKYRSIAPDGLLTFMKKDYKRLAKNFKNWGKLVPEFYPDYSMLQEGHYSNDRDFVEDLSEEELYLLMASNLHRVSNMSYKTALSRLVEE